jgi:hypothetical protein
MVMYVGRNNFVVQEANINEAVLKKVLVRALDF